MGGTAMGHCRASARYGAGVLTRDAVYAGRRSRARRTAVGAPLRAAALALRLAHLEGPYLPSTAGQVHQVECMVCLQELYPQERAAVVWTCARLARGEHRN